MNGALYEASLAGLLQVDVESTDMLRRPLPIGRWFGELPGDGSILGRCRGPVLDVGSGPGRLTVALSRRGHPALGIDIAQHAVDLVRNDGGLALRRDVFARVPGAGRWETVLLADGNVGIGGEPCLLLARVAQLLCTGGCALVEVEPPGRRTSRQTVRLRCGPRRGPWFPWASVGLDDAALIAQRSGLTLCNRWASGGRWFVAMARG